MNNKLDNILSIMVWELHPGLRTSDRVLWETEGCLQDLSQPEEGGALLVFREGLSHQDQKGGHLSAGICGDSPPDRIL